MCKRESVECANFHKLEALVRCYIEELLFGKSTNQLHNIDHKSLSCQTSLCVCVCVCVSFAFLFSPDFGQRPRRLYVIINPVCGGDSGVECWRKVEPMFNSAHIHTDYLGEQ